MNTVQSNGPLLHYLTNMDLNKLLVVFLIIYLLAMAAEIYYDHFAKKKFYNFKDSITNVVFGLLALFMRLLTKGAWLAFWFFLYGFSFFKMPETLWSWVLLFFCNEFIYYWFHRLSHENKFLWAVHVSHHSSTKLNLTTAARIPLFNLVLHNIFWIPLLIIGFHPLMIFTIENVSFLMAAFQHTQVIRRIPVIDYFLNTPSHHRVHHASNTEYVNRNYGNVLIIFDRLFGTFKKEENAIAIQFGVAGNEPSINPLKFVFREFRNLMKHGIKRPLSDAKHLNASELSETDEKYASESACPIQLNKPSI